MSAMKRAAVASLFRALSVDDDATRSAANRVSLVETLETTGDFYTQLYALACLLLLDDDAVDVDALRRSVPAPTAQETEALHDALGADNAIEERIEAVEIVGCVFQARPDATDFKAQIPRVVFLLRNDDVRLAAAAARTAERLSDAYAELLAELGAVQLLLGLVRRGDAQAHAAAASSLGSLAQNRPAIQDDGVAAGGIALLVDRLQSQDDAHVRVGAALGLAGLVDGNANHQTAAIDAGAWPLLVELACNRRGADQVAAVAAIGSLLDGHVTNQTVASASVTPGLEPALFAMLEPTQPSRSKQVAALTIASLVRGHRTNQTTYGDSRFLDRLLAMLRSTSNDNRATAARAIASLVDAHDANKTAMVNASVVGQLVAILCEAPVLNATAVVASALSSIACQCDVGKAAIVDAGAVAPLVNVLRNGDDAAKHSAAMALYFLSDENDVVTNEIVTLGALPELLRMAQTSHDDQHVVAALVTLGALSKASSTHDAFVGLNAHDVLKDLQSRPLMVRALATQVRQNLAPSRPPTAASGCLVQ